MINLCSNGKVFSISFFSPSSSILEKKYSVPGSAKHYQMIFSPLRYLHPGEIDTLVKIYSSPSNDTPPHSVMLTHLSPHPCTKWPPFSRTFSWMKSFVFWFKASKHKCLTSNVYASSETKQCVRKCFYNYCTHICRSIVISSRNITSWVPQVRPGFEAGCLRNRLLSRLNARF